MIVNLNSLKNGIAAAAIGVSTLGAGCAKKAPAIEKAAVQTSQTAKMIANNLTKDTVTFAKAKAYTDSLKHVNQSLKFNQDMKYTKGLVETLINTTGDLKKADYAKFLKVPVHDPFGTTMRNVRSWTTSLEKDRYNDLYGVAWKNEIEHNFKTMEYLRNFVQNIKTKEYTDSLGKEIKDNDRTIGLIETLTNLAQNLKTKKY